ncbi:hypothetical protein KKG31_06430 [Patescibacteria group bacterium]|nr:hypothetical protein [Patescibacteria group bacterium]MBU1758732.1 hypothetical protein [Patescibacteria group bacterium]
MSEEEIIAILKSNGFEEKLFNTFIKNNNELAKSIHTEINLHQALFPNYDTPDDIKEIYEKAKDGLVVSE